MLLKTSPEDTNSISEIIQLANEGLEKVKERLTREDGAAARLEEPASTSYVIHEFNEEGGRPMSVSENLLATENASLSLPTGNFTTSIGESIFTAVTGGSSVEELQHLVRTTNTGAVPKTVHTLPRTTGLDSMIQPVVVFNNDSPNYQSISGRSQNACVPRSEPISNLSLPFSSNQATVPTQIASRTGCAQSLILPPSSQVARTSLVSTLPEVNVLSYGDLHKSSLKPNGSSSYPTSSRLGDTINRPPLYQVRPQVQSPAPPEMRLRNQHPQRVSAHEHMRRGNTNPVPNWQIRFDGSPRGLAVDDFLFRVETLARADVVPFNNLVFAIHQLLSGRAATCYWQFCRKVPRANWQQLSYSLRREFEDSETNYDLRKLIKSRKQRSRESFADFRLEMEGLALRLREPMNQTELLQIVQRNMHPALRKTLVLHTFNNLDDIDRLCRQIEKLWADVGESAEDQIRIRRYNIHQLEYDYCEQKMQDESMMYQELDHYERSDAEVAVMEREGNNGKTYIICWNCDDIGHTYLDCPSKVRRIFCYTCGAKNIIRPNCINCMRGNQKAGQGQRGRPNPLKPILTPQRRQLQVDRSTMTSETECPPQTSRTRMWILGHQEPTEFARIL